MHVTLIGRVNVGNSTLFNTLTERHDAIVSSIPGTTRDTKHAHVTWRNCSFTLSDTAGLDVRPSNALEQNVRTLSMNRIKESDVLIIVVDIHDGLTSADNTIIRLARKEHKSLILAVNKADSPKIRMQADVFYQTGLPVHLVSAKNGSGTGDLLDAVVAAYSPKKK